jgi:crotonobetainyl-CoA:carnitine CoA-transferase CaiB-like acyl-CoA transferase
MMEPFTGLRVLDLSHTRVGAQASQLFADFGAEVVMVEPPGGSELRSHAAFPFWARGKKSLALDLDVARDRETISALARGADVLIEDFRVGELDALGLGYEALRKGNPGLVYCSITGFGSKGPYTAAPTDGALVMAKLGVFEAFSRLSPVAGRPAFVTAPYAGFAASQVALYGTLAALHERERSGLGQKVEANLAQSFLSIDTWAWIEHVLASRYPDALKPIPSFDDQGRPRSHLMMRLLVAMTSDGEWLQFAATAPRLFAAKMRALGLDWMFKDPEWEGLPGFEDPDKSMALWTRMLKAAREKSSADWDRIFDQDGDVFAERFRAGTAILEHPQLVHDGMTVTLEDPERGPVRQPGPLVKAARTPAQLRPAPRLDEHRNALLERGWASARRAPPAQVSPAPSGLPLEGITIVEMATMFAAPQGPTLLTELGARVIKIEQMGGDPIRHLITLPETGGTRVMQGKESICVDLSKPEGIEIVRRLIAGADVLIQGFRAGAIQRLGLDYDAVSRFNPDIIYVNAPGYGVDGPYGARPAYAPSIGAAAGLALTNLGISGAARADLSIAELQAMSRRLGWAGTHVNAQADGVAAVAVATSILFGIYARDCGAGGQQLFTSMLNSGAHMMSAHAVNWPGNPPEALVDPEMRGLGALYRIYECATGFIFLAADSEADWRCLARALAGQADLAGDPRFSSREDRRRNDRELAAALAGVFATRPAADWERELPPQKIGCVEVASISTEATLLDTPLGRESGYIADVEDPTWGETPRQAALVRLSRSATQAKPAVLAGQHTDALLAEFGFGAAIERLRGEAVVG